ncbi:hypothetical protein ACIP79_00700 [Streptomyces sp. NPDC088747]|uniref:hypothetical protein n=1 Tax=Streptomyces sp. NPDC088747 TaxID=3365886 RepID=UPI003825AC10
MPERVTEDWCFSHGRVEPDDENTYRVCLECSHVFQTEADLIRDHNAELAEVRVRQPGAPVLPDATSGEEIWTCPHCIHDF